MFDVVNGGRPLRMAYTDVPPTVPASGRTAVLMHGESFFSRCWANVVLDFAGRDHRVAVPHQIGFEKSSKPDFDYPFGDRAADTLALPDRPGATGPVDLVDRSTTGMLAVRVAPLHPDRVRRLALGDPIGLEDDRDPHVGGTGTDDGLRQHLHRPSLRVYPEAAQGVLIDQRAHRRFRRTRTPAKPRPRPTRRSVGRRCAPKTGISPRR